MSQAALASERRYPPRKREMMERLQRYASEHSCIAVCPLTKVGSLLINEYRRRLRGKVLFLVPRIRLAAKAFSSLGEGLAQLAPHLRGQVLLAFANMDPFELVSALSELKISVPAKPGDVATEPIVVPAGNTGLPPGPVLTEFREFKIPTKVEGGTIWVAKDTQVAKPGDVISPKLAALLRRFNLKPMKAELPISLVYWRGRIIPAEGLRLDVEGFSRSLAEAQRQALALGLETQYPDPLILRQLLARAFGEALALAEQADELTPENAALLIARAVARAKALEALLAS
jgi:large subunit ribosomal protein L10